jgi:hypothetical protein
MIRQTNVRRISPKIALNKFLLSFSDSGRKMLPESSLARRIVKPSHYWEVYKKNFICYPFLTGKNVDNFRYFRF